MTWSRSDLRVEQVKVGPKMTSLALARFVTACSSLAMSSRRGGEDHRYLGHRSLQLGWLASSIVRGAWLSPAPLLMTLPIAENLQATRHHSRESRILASSPLLLATEEAPLPVLGHPSVAELMAIFLPR